MYFNGPGRQRGHVLLVAGDVAVRRRVVQLAPSANVAALAMVPAGVLLGSDVPSDMVCLDGVRDPNTVLARLRAAAATRGPLLVYLSGRLTVDRRGRRLHVALAGTTAGSVRYTSLPWEWLGGELRGRPAGLTTVVLDLVADGEAWPVLREYGSLPAFPCAEVYGVVSPPGFAAGEGNAVSGYTGQWIDQLRRGHVRPANVALHAWAAGMAALPPGTLVLPTARELALRTTPEHPQPRQQPYPQPLSQQQAQSPPGPVSAPSSAPAPAQAPISGPAPEFAGISVPAQAPAPAPGPSPASVQASKSAGSLVSAQAPASTPGLAAAQASGQVSGQVSGPVTGFGGDPRPRLHALARGGRHVEAAALAGAWEQYVVETCGYASLEAMLWAEIRADLARMAGDFPLATRLWIGVSQARLACQGAGDPGVQAATAGALYCWTQLKDPVAAVELGPDLLRLLRVLPSPDPRHLQLAQQRLQVLRTRHGPRALNP
ncbi:hypothetical protein ACH4U5_39635 [Streptomyces sp. NPDC020858]|uniref:hypothetical protein n=1 Tax=Streptomyces sp. NPDC020858 TaxID=3365097 RepID=UPI00379E1CC0